MFHTQTLIKQKMRAIIIMLTLFTFTNCNDSRQKTVSKNDRLELIPEPDKDLREKYEQQQKDSMSTDTTYEEILGENLKPIKENFKKINAIKEWSTIDKQKLDESTKSDSATYYFLKNILLKIVAIHLDEKGKTIQEYYTLDNELSFVLESTYNYNESLIPDSTAIKKNNDKEEFEISKLEVIEDRSYFENGVLIRQINNQDCGLPFAQDYLKEEQIRLKIEFEKLLNLIKK